MTELSKWTYWNTPDFGLEGISGPARIVNVHDGDTVTLAMNVFGGYYKFNCRIDGIDTNELNSKFPSLKTLAYATRNRVLQILGFNSIHLDDKLSRKEILQMLYEKVIIVIARCKQYDKYGRILCDIFVDDKSLADILIEENLAVLYDGGKKMNDAEMQAATQTTMSIK